VQSSGKFLEWISLNNDDDDDDDDDEKCIHMSHCHSMTDSYVSAVYNAWGIVESTKRHVIQL